MTRQDTAFFECRGEEERKEEWTIAGGVDQDALLQRPIARNVIASDVYSRIIYRHVPADLYGVVNQIKKFTGKFESRDFYAR